MWMKSKNIILLGYNVYNEIINKNIGNENSFH